MKKLYLGLGIFIVLMNPFFKASFASSIKEDMHYWGYSKELSDYAASALEKSHKSSPPAPSAPVGKSAPDSLLEEATAVKEQLAELGRSRSLTQDTTDRSMEIRQNVDKYWNAMGGTEGPNVQFLSPEVKTKLKEGISSVLQEAGYEIKQIDLIDTAPNMGTPQVRAVVRVVRPLTTANGYQEIQSSLSEIKTLCLGVSTIDGVRYLNELTTFIAENPRNKYFYEKTILNP